MTPGATYPGLDPDMDPPGLQYLVPRPLDEQRWREEAAADIEAANMEPADVGCVICLDSVDEPCKLSPCGHRSFHLVCIDRWLKIAALCPVCKAAVARAVHGPADRRQTTDYPLDTPRDRPFVPIPNQQRADHYHLDHPPLRQARGARYEPDGLAFRRDIYRHLRFSMHVGSNPVSQYREITQDMFHTDLDLQSRAKTFLRRELRVFCWLATPDAHNLMPLAEESPRSFLDRKRTTTVERLLGHIMWLLQHFDIRGSDGSVEEDVTMHLGRENTRLLLHELHAFLRSPHNRLEDWDREVQYADITEPRSALDTNSTSIHWANR